MRPPCVRLIHKNKYPVKRGVSNLYCGSYTSIPALENAFSVKRFAYSAYTYFLWNGLNAVAYLFS